MKRGIKHKSFFVLQVTFSLKYAEILFVGMVFIVSIISPHVIIESTITLSVHLLFLQTQVLNNFFCTHVFLNSHRYLSLFHFRFELHFIPSNLHLYSHGICLLEFLFHLLL